MKIHEYQAKALLADYGVPVPRGKVASTLSEAGEIARELKGRVVVKAQVHAGGRGRAGGIKVDNSPEEVEKSAERMLGRRLSTYQTTAEGVLVSKVLVEEALDIERELYLAVVVDGSSRMPVMMASEAGGMDIEEIARNSPKKILRVFVDPPSSFPPFQARKLAYGLNLNAAQIRPAMELMMNLYRLFWTKDCSLVEINPLVTTAGGKVVALDAKVNFDDSALFRHSDIQALRDLEQEDPLEVRARDLGMNNYIKMTGNIGCMVNGAGLAMAVMDMIAQLGGSVANFLDVGVANNIDRVVNAFRMFASDPGIKVVLINIFGGITRVDVIARGIVEAYKQIGVHFPIVIRLAGTNVEDGKRILAESGISYLEAGDLYDAAQKAVMVARRKR